MNNQIKCGFCGIVNWESSENCIKCNKSLRQSAYIYQTTAKTKGVSSTKKFYFTVAMIISTAIIGSFLIIDKTSRTSLFERQFHRVTAPNEEIIKKAITSRINDGYADFNVTDPGYSSTTMQCQSRWSGVLENGSYDSKCLYSSPEFDEGSFRPVVTEKYSAELNSYEILSAEISKYSSHDFSDYIPAEALEPAEIFIRYKAKVKVDQNKSHSVTSSLPDPKKDFQKTEKQVTEITIALRWNPKKSAWEICRYFN